MAVSTYEVRVSGPVEVETLLDLGVVAQGHEGAQTVLYGEIRDESALFGLLTRLRDLGLEVIEVRQSPTIDWIGPAPDDDREATAERDEKDRQSTRSPGES